jgi:Lon protease-like protein
LWDVGDPLPLFPLSTVLFPQMPLSLLIFEERYRALVAELLDRPPEQRSFGVVAIRDGYEVGELAVHSAHRVGCEAFVRQVQRRPDGRFDLEAVGRRRFRVLEVNDEHAFLTGDVAWLDTQSDEAARPQASGQDVAGSDTSGSDTSGSDTSAPDPGSEDELRARQRALSAFAAYCRRLSIVRQAPVAIVDLPTAPTDLSYALAAAGSFLLSDRQALLEEPDSAHRLLRLAELLRSETRAMTAVPSLPASEVSQGGWSPN